MPGSIAGNPHQGVRSEYLAQYIFSAFGTAIPVPHPEDSGVDMYCTLGHSVGKRFVVSDYFMVQVKSSKEPIEYKGSEQVTWLLSHNYPLLYCFVNKAKGLVEIYQTARLSFLNTGDAIQSVTLAPDVSQGELLVHPNNPNPIIPLEQPILSFQIDYLSNPVLVKKGRDVLSGWVRLDQENINLRSTGFTMFRYPQAYSSNQPLDGLSKFEGTFRKLASDDPRNIKFHDVLFRLLSQQINRTVAAGDVESFNAIEKFARSMTEGKSVPDCWGFMIFAFSYNTGLKEFGLPGGIFLEKSDGSKHYLEGKSVRVDA